MRRLIPVVLIFAVACEGTIVPALTAPISPDSHARFELEADEVCPIPYIASATIPGNVYPNHKVTIGTTLKPWTFMSIVDISQTGLEAGKYAMPPGPWKSDDHKIYYVSGNVKGWCRYNLIPDCVGFWCSTGALQVYDFEGEWISVPPPKARFSMTPSGGSAAQTAITRSPSRMVASGSLSANDDPGNSGSVSDGETLNLSSAQNVYLDGSNSQPGDTVITAYDWHVDGTPVLSSAQGYVFFDPGTVAVDLIVTDGNDLADTASATVSVADSTAFPSGGGGGSDDPCWDVFLVWYDDNGQEVEEEYLFTFCCGEDGCFMQ